MCGLDFTAKTSIRYKLPLNDHLILDIRMYFYPIW